MANITLLGASYTDVPAVDLPKTGGGTVRFYENGGASAQIATGSVTGDGTTTLDISCNFEPDLIYIHGDMSGSNSNRGVVSITIVKDTVIYMTNDSSTSNANENSVYIDHGISGYGDSTVPHAAYSNGTLTLDTVTNTTAYRFRSGQVYNYKLIKWT